MSHAGQNNAMTEIALALAMAFFAIMILAFVSMGSGATSAKAKQASKTGLDAGAVLTASDKPEKSEQNNSQQTTQAKPDQLLIFFNGKFFDAALKETDPARFAEKARQGNGPLVVAVSPDLTVTEAIKVEKQVPGINKTVTTLDQRWVKALKEIYK